VWGGSAVCDWALPDLAVLKSPLGFYSLQEETIAKL
jgi:hypothetical protein